MLALVCTKRRICWSFCLNNTGTQDHTHKEVSVKQFATVLVVLLLISSAFAVPTTMDQAQLVAQRAAVPIFGDLITLSSATMLAPDGTPSAYAFVFGRNGTTSINMENVLAGYNLRQTGMITEGWQLARDPADYAYAYIAVDNNFGPVLEMCDGLPAHLIFIYDVKAMGEAALGSNVEIEINYYLGGLENWYKVSNAQGSVVVNPRRELTFAPDLFATFGSRYDFPANSTAPEYWTKLLTAPSAGADNEGYISGVPNFNQRDTDCGPHSSAQTVGYWDNHTYMSQGPWPLLIDSDFWALCDEMRAAMGWVSGSGVTVEEITNGILTVCNDPAYGNNYSFDDVQHDNPAYGTCTAAVDAGRPGEICTFNHPTYGNHAMSLMGYNDTPTQMIQVHDNWPPDTDEPLLEWNATFDAFVDVFPAGGAATPITLKSFTGNYANGSVQLSWTTASEIDCYGYNLLRSSGEGFVQVNEAMIPASGSAVETYTYSFTDVSAQPGQTYTYALQTAFVDGRAEISSQITLKTLSYDLAQNSPNPFNASTSIRYMVPQAGFVTLSVFDLQGQQVANLVQGYQEANQYAINFNASDLSSGIYFYRLQVGDFTSMKKMVLLK